jgi:hypothetical protein
VIKILKKPDGGLSPIFNISVALAIVTIALLIFIGADSALAASIGFSPGSRTVDQGSTTTYQIILDSAPAGLSGYDIEVSVAGAGTAVITDVSFPSWAGLHQVMTGLPAGTVRITGVDLSSQVQNGSTNVLLATITVRGESAGETDLSVSLLELDSDSGTTIAAGVTPGHLTVQGTPGASPTATPVPGATSSPTPLPTTMPTNETATPTPVPTSGPTTIPTQMPSYPVSPSPVPGFTGAETLVAGLSLFCMALILRSGTDR